MILRQGVNGAIHFAGGVVMGVTLILAACTIARTAQLAARKAGVGPGALSGRETGQEPTGMPPGADPSMGTSSMPASPGDADQAPPPYSQGPAPL
ncbi:MAG: hypothetical protein ACFBSD_11275 [Paracoccaceae bacterium]